MKNIISEKEWIILKESKGDLKIGSEKDENISSFGELPKHAQSPQNAEGLKIDLELNKDYQDEIKESINEEGSQSK